MDPRNVADDRARLRSEGTLTLGRELVERFGQLARKEVELARAEIKLDARRAVVAGTLGGIAAVCAVAALACGLFAAIAGLGYVIPMWLASVIGFALFAVTGLLFLVGAISRAERARPRRSIREAKATLGMLESLGKNHVEEPATAAAGGDSAAARE